MGSMHRTFRRLPILFVLLVLAVVACRGADRATQDGIVQFRQAEAAPSGWHAHQPGDRGWTPVALPDDWARRWSRHDGVVWYRMRWWQRDAGAPIALWLDRVSLADAIYVNGSLVYQAPHLDEPLSRIGVSPQYFLVDAPLLRAGLNTLVVRVSGLAAYAPGLGQVAVGDPARLLARYRRGVWQRVDMDLFDLSVDAVLATLFGMVWLLRRRDTLYGWFALASVGGLLFDLDFVARSPWPFATTNAWMALHAAAHMATAICFAQFLLRYADRRWPRIERSMIALGAITLAVAAAWPGWLGPHHVIIQNGAVALMYASIVLFIGFALRSRAMELVVPAMFLVLPMVAAVHDSLVRSGVISSTTYLSDLTSPVSLVGISFVLAYRFVVAMRRAEGFNAALALEVDRSTLKLRETLDREQTLALANARMAERLELVRDLHDGFGGSLLGAIEQLQATPGMKADTAIEMLKSVRDDLRLVIESTVYAEDRCLADLMAAFRHRCCSRMELAGIRAEWQFDDLAGVRFTPSRALDVLRLLQEALNNVIKHSGARACRVRLELAGDVLQFEVSDDGCGFDVAASGGVGAGMASLRVRAARLGAWLSIQSRPGSGTCVTGTVRVREPDAMSAPEAVTMVGRPAPPGPGRP